jgi:peptidylprolyl isomerase domain and WD repeat-containing protein 1
MITHSLFTVVNIITEELVRVIGLMETERFLRVGLYQGKYIGSAAAGESTEPLDDPSIFCCAYKKPRFYIFSQRDPEDVSG